MNEKNQQPLNAEQLVAIAEQVLRIAKAKGASQAEVEIGANKGFSINVRQGDVETIEYNQDKNLSLTVYNNKASGSASISDFRDEAIEGAVAAACNIAKFTDQDPYAGLAEKKQLAFDYPHLDLAHSWSITVAEAIELAKECEAHAMAQDKRITNCEATSIATTYAHHVYANSQGFVGAYPISRHELSCVLIASKNDEMQRDYYYTVACDPTLLEPWQKVAELAALRTVRRLGAKTLPTQRIPVIFAAEEARGLLGHFISAISGGNLYRKSSFLLDHLSRAVFPAHITLKEHPHLPKGLGSAPFDEDGLATRPNVFVQDGVLQSYVLGVYSARKLNMQPTGNGGGVHNLSITHGNQDLPGLLKKMDRGLLVTELMGQGVNIVTGDYSRGAAGFWVENGVIQYPVQEVTIAGNLADMYRNLVEVGADIDRRGNIQTGSILIEQMMVAGS